MIVVHTMARVGSVALQQAIQRNHPDEQIFHSHLWSNASLERLMAEGQDHRNYKLIEAATNDGAVWRHVLDAIYCEEPVYVHWINRDPVARSVSLLHYLIVSMDCGFSFDQQSFEDIWQDALLEEPETFKGWLFAAYRWHEATEVPVHPLVTVYRHRQEVMAGVSDIPRLNVGQQGETGLTLPREMLERIYSHPAVTRDYNPAEIEEFTQRWAA